MKRTPRRRATSNRSAKARHHLLARRNGMVEALERRELLAADLVSGWHNTYNPQDVNFDQRINSTDLLVVINDLLINGARAVSVDTATPLSSLTGSAKPKLIDVTNDGRINASDAMSVINSLLTDEVLKVSTVITDMNDNPITTVAVGSQFKLVTYAQDVRNPPPANPNFRGVFSAGVQINFSSALTSLDVSQTVAFGPTFDLTPEANLQQGQIIGWGASTATTGPGNSPQKLFTVVLTAEQPGLQNFVASFDSTQDHDNNLYVHPDVPLPADDVYFEGAVLEILGESGLSVTGPGSQSETNGDSQFLFTVNLSSPLTDLVTVEYATSDGTATVADNDYLAASGTLTFAPGQTVHVVTVTVKGDQKVEPDETFTLTLSNPSSNAVLSSPVATATIVNDDILGVLAINASSVQNVAVGTTEAFFTVTLSQPPAGTVTVQYATQDDTAVAGTDYVAKSGTLTFTPGTTSLVVPVTIIGSDLADDVDRFFVNLSNPSANAELDVAQTQISILPAVSGVNVSILPGPSNLEGNSGTTPFVFTLQLSAPSSQPAIVGYRTVANGNAEQDVDFQAVEGLVTFLPGQVERTVTVQVIGDNSAEPNETFSLQIEAISGATGTSSAIATIVDDDGTPGLIISDAEVAAGAGITTATFTVTLTGEVTGPVSVGFATTDGSAVAGQDYLQASGNLSFDAANRTRVIEVTILSSQRPEADKTFFVVLSSATGGAVINDPQGVGTIITQGFSISDATVVEGNEGTRNAVFTVTLSRLLEQEVSVVYQTVAGGTATALTDYEPVSGTLTFAPGVTTQFVTVQVKGDTEQELNETFRVQLSDAQGAPLFNSIGTGTIINDDGRKVNYRLALLSETGQEIPLDSQFDVGDEFYLAVFVQDVQLIPSGVAQAFIDVVYNEALVDVDTSTLTWGPFFRSPPGAFQKFDFEPGRLNDFGAFGSTTNPPAIPGAEQELYRVLFRTTDVGLLNFVGSVNESDLDPDSSTLLYLDVNVDPVPSDQMNPINSIAVNVGSNVIAVANSSASESAGQMVFTVTRFLPTNETATVVYSTQNGTALAGQDYVAKTGTLTFAPGGPTTQLVTISLINDGVDEPDESFSLLLSNPAGAEISESAATGTIINDDPPVNVSVQSASASEGQGVVFNVNLAGPSGKTVTVVYSTSPTGTATPGVDYTPVTGTLTFAPGTTQQSVTVPTLADILLEANETFQLVISDPMNAAITTGSATGTIVDVPPAGISGYVYFDMNNNGLKDLNETGVPGVTITATNNSTGQSQSVLTNADGSYAIVGLIPGNYTLTQTQPGFYTDGRDTRFGIDSPLNDQFVNIQLDPSEAESGYHFGEQGIRGDFVSAFINRRAFFASAVVGGQLGPNVNMAGSVLDLRTGDLWVSFDGGWSGIRQIDALFNAASGTASMKLYNNALQEIALSAPSATGASLFYNGTLGQTYFLKISGNNPNVTVQIAAAPAVNLPASTGGSSSQSSTPASNPPVGSSGTGTGSFPFNRFSSAGPMAATPDADPLVSAADDTFAEDEDWLTEALFA